MESTTVDWNTVETDADFIPTLLSPAEISVEYKRRWHEAFDHIWQDGKGRRPTFVEIDPLEVWYSEQWRAWRDKERADQAKIESKEKREKQKSSGMVDIAMDQAAAQVKRVVEGKPVKVGNECLVCGELIPPTGKRGRPRRVHVNCAS